MEVLFQCFHDADPGSGSMSKLRESASMVIWPELELVICLGYCVTCRSVADPDNFASDPDPA